MGFDYETKHELHVAAIYLARFNPRAIRSLSQF